MSLLGIRIAGEKKIDFVPSEVYSRDRKEEDLHGIIEDNPRLIMKSVEGESVSVLTVGTHMRLPEGTELDLLFLNEKGEIFLVELKRDHGSRDAIAQLMDYSSSLAQMELEEFEKHLKGFDGVQNVMVTLQERFSLPDEELNLDEFKEGVARCLRGRGLTHILVSYNIDEDAERIANWLRDRYKMVIYCVEFDYFRRDKTEYFVPRIIGGEEADEMRLPRKISPMNKKYQDFWKEVLGRFKSEKPGITARRAPPDSYCQIPVKQNDIHLEWVFEGPEPNKYLQVAVHFERKNREENHQLLDHFKKMEEDIKKAVNEELRFERWATAGNWGRIFASRPVGTMDKALSKDDLKDWAVDRMKRLYEFFKPKLDEYFRA